MKGNADPLLTAVLQLHQQSYKHEITVEKGRIIMSIENSEEGILATARRILKLGPICDNCLGRQFAMLSTGLTNAERGSPSRPSLPWMQRRTATRSCRRTWPPPSGRQGSSIGRKDEEDARCSVCLGEMRPENLNRWADRVAEALRGWEYSTFLVGTKISGLLAETRRCCWRMAVRPTQSPSSLS